MSEKKLFRETKDFESHNDDGLRVNRADPNALLITAWKCRYCGCLWRDNHDDTVSLLNTEQNSCEECEYKPTQTTCDSLDAKALYALGRKESEDVQ